MAPRSTSCATTNWKSRNFFDNGEFGSPVPPQSVWRQHGRSHQEGQNLLLRELRRSALNADRHNIVTVPDECAHQFLTSTAPSGVCGAPVAQNGTPYATNLAVRQAIRNRWRSGQTLPSTNFVRAGPQRYRQAFVPNPNIGNENYVPGSHGLHIVRQRLCCSSAMYSDRATRNFTTGVPYWPELDTTRDNFMTVEERRIISARLVNSAHVGFSRTWEDANVYGSHCSQWCHRGCAFGSKRSGRRHSARNHQPVPAIIRCSFRNGGRPRGRHTASFSGITALGASTTLPFYLVPNKFQLGDDVIWTRALIASEIGVNATRLTRKYLGAFRGGRQLGLPQP